MKTIHLTYRSVDDSSVKLAITGSKSETNRLLLLQALFSEIDIENKSQSDDSVVLGKGLQNNSGIIDVHHAGTAMRFLTAYCASQEELEVTLTGSARMRQRPIGLLVDALRDLGADIRYENNEGFPPICIKGKKLIKNEVAIKANVSSQFISALMLIGPSMPNGLTIRLQGKATSIPYIKMTESLLKSAGINVSFIGNRIKIKNISEVIKTTITVESDWSSASYFYSIVALSKHTEITLSSYRKNSIQGDAVLQEIYAGFGVKTIFNEPEKTITLSKIGDYKAKDVELDLANTPDIAQTIAVTCFGLGIGCKLVGLHTLKIKETDRLVALKTELEKLGAEVNITEDSLVLLPRKIVNKNVAIDTYNDHRMAMAFAPLALQIPLSINDPKVVSKSFPDFWQQLECVGIISENK